MVQLAFDDWACRGNRHQKDRDIHHREASLRCKCKVNVAHVRKITIIAHFPKQPPKRDFTVTRPGSSSIPTTITGKSRTYHSGLVSETRWGVKKAAWLLMAENYQTNFLIQLPETFAKFVTDLLFFPCSLLSVHLFPEAANRLASYYNGPVPVSDRLLAVRGKWEMGSHPRL